MRQCEADMKEIIQELREKYSSMKSIKIAEDIIKLCDAYEKLAEKHERMESRLKKLLWKWEGKG